MGNYDEVVLRSRRLHPGAPFPLLHQALRIAMYDEYAARAFYGKVVEAFGQKQPFVNIVIAEDQHVAALGKLCERYGVPRPHDPFSAETTVSPSWRANLERGVAGEVANVQLYQYLLTEVPIPEVRRVFLNLQTASLENHLPAFQRALESAVAQEGYHAMRGIAPSQAYVRHGPVTDTIEKAFSLLASQHGAFGLVGSLVRATHPTMLAGMVAGATAVHFMRQSVSSKLFQTKED